MKRLMPRIDLFFKAVAVLMVSIGLYYGLARLYAGLNLRDAFRWAISESKVLAKRENNVHERKRIYQESSPNGERTTVLFEVPFTGEGDLDYKNYLSNRYVYVVETPANGREVQVFVNDYKTGYPHWLGDKHIFFTSGCGTGCQGIYLVNVDSKESSLALLETIPRSETEFETRFHDWFGQEHAFSGWVDHMRSVSLNDQVYFVFQIKNHGRELQEKKFLFTENSLRSS